MVCTALVGVRPEPVKAATASISAKTLMMKKGQTFKLKVAGVKVKKWSSSNTKVASVKKGKVKAKKKGSATITAKAGKKSYKCAVTVTDGTKKSLVIYFSATGITKTAAEKVKTVANADMIRLMPKKAYTSADLDYDSNCRANDEQEKDAKPAIATVIINLNQYDTIYLGYPIWWGKEPGVIRTFLGKADLSSKTIMPFCTSGSSGISGSMDHIRTMAKGATVKDGKDLTDASLADIEKWIEAQTGGGTATPSPSPEPTSSPEPTVTPTPTATTTPTTNPTSVPARNKTLVAYFSVTGSTKGVAEKIVSLTGADKYEIVPKIPYTSSDIDYNNNMSRTSIEQNDTTIRPEIAGNKLDLSAYSRIYLGYPIWWGMAPRIMDTFVESYPFDGITIVPFCTSGSSGIGSSADRLKELAKTGAWISGHRFAGGASETEIRTWIDSI